MRIDLHTHSTASDGTDSPTDLVRAAAAAGLDVVALTDHDTVGGLAEAAAALPAGLTLVPGAEISCRLRDTSLHLLGYLFDPDEPEFARERDAIRNDRVRRAEKMVARCRELGAPITWDQVRRIAGGGSVGRPHVASALVEAGIVPDVGSAFSPEWIGDRGRADIRKHEIDPARAIALIHNAGGVTVFAHPGASVRGPVVSNDDIAELAAAGLDGIEVDHVDHDAATRTELRGLAADLGLLATGSSDYHGSRKHVALGAETTAPDAYEALVSRATARTPLRGGETVA